MVHCGILAMILATAGAGSGFKVGIEMPTQVPVSKAVEAGLREMGINYINFYTKTFPNVGDAPEMDTFRAMTDLCRRLRMDFSLSCHVYDPSDQVVKAAVAWNADPKRACSFRGVVFDELAHIRLLNFGRPTAIADYKNFKSLPQAYDESVKGFEKLRAKFEAMGSPVVATHVFPVLLHATARAGFIPCPKICKEEYSTVSLATGMGAAKEYGRPLWADCDLWLYDLLPGHPPEEFRSNLLLAYWLGAEVVYVEGAGFNLKPAGHQGTPFSLLNVVDPSTVQLTPHGEVLRWFCRDYVPNHPRPWTIADLRPDIAIIRYDDSDWGQSLAGFTRGLFGTDRLPSTPDTRSVFGAWDMLTFGATGDDGLTMMKPRDAAFGYQRPRREGDAVWPSYLSRPVQAEHHRFWVPLNGAVVYDQNVGYDLLKKVPLLIAAGPDLSDKTMAAIRRCVDEGATCVMWGPLAKRKGFAQWTSGALVVPEGKGKFVLTDEFRLPEVMQQIWMFVGHPDTIRYRFGDHVVELRRVTDNEVSVEVDGHPEGP